MRTASTRLRIWTMVGIKMVAMCIFANIIECFGDMLDRFRVDFIPKNPMLLRYV